MSSVINLEFVIFALCTIQTEFCAFKLFCNNNDSYIFKLQILRLSGDVTAENKMKGLCFHTSVLLYISPSICASVSHSFWRTNWHFYVGFNYVSLALVHFCFKRNIFNLCPNKVNFQVCSNPLFDNIF